MRLFAGIAEYPETGHWKIPVVERKSSNTLNERRLKQMKKIFLGLIGTVMSVALLVCPVMAQESDQQDVSQYPGGVRSLEERMERLEGAFDQMDQADKWYERFQVGGLIEVEAGFGRTSFADPAQDDEKTGDVDLATVELGIGVKISDHADVFVLFKYEEDELFVDEGHITLTGTDSFPAYLIAGRQYIPFGNFESHFITDPTTLCRAKPMKARWCSATAPSATSSISL
jgi:hypothetical protein